MSKQQVLDQILSDARAEAEQIVSEAERKAAVLLAAADKRVEELERTTEQEMQERRKTILEKRAAAARLDGAKLLLGEKRKVLDAMYDEALSRLLELGAEDCVSLFSRLLSAYAEEGDVIVLAKNFPYEEQIKLLPIIAEKNMKISPERQVMDGGMRLQGVTSDKDLSFGAILNADREQRQAELARVLFN